MPTPNLPMQQAPLFCHDFVAMGSPCEIRIHCRTPSQAERLFASTRSEITRLEQRYSRFIPGSIVSAINQTASLGGSITLDEETASLLDYADSCFLSSHGLFDITSGALSFLWKGAQKLPDPAQIEATRQRTGWDKLSWNSPKLSFPLAGMAIDLGGIVKEYAADRVAEILLQEGIDSGLISLGGDIQILGPHPDGTPWPVGIQHPRQPDQMSRFVDIQHGAIATSGDYERSLIIEGVRYGHIINPRTGYPSRKFASVTTIADLCVIAGSLCTIAILLEDDGPAWLQQQGVSYFWEDQEGHTGSSFAC